MWCVQCAWRCMNVRSLSCCPTPCHWLSRLLRLPPLRSIHSVSWLPWLGFSILEIVLAYASAARWFGKCSVCHMTVMWLATLAQRRRSIATSLRAMRGWPSIRQRWYKIWSKRLGFRVQTCVTHQRISQRVSSLLNSVTDDLFFCLSLDLHWYM